VRREQHPRHGSSRCWDWPSGALGIAILWASGIDFPIYPPPGILILLAGAIFTLTSLRWAAGVGASLALFVLVGFLASPTGLSNLAGGAGTSVAIGQGIQVIGVLIALPAGVMTTWTNYGGSGRELGTRPDVRGPS